MSVKNVESIYCEKNLNTINKSKLLFGSILTVLSVVLVASYFFDLNCSIYGVQHFIQTMSQIPLMPYYVATGAFGLGAAGIKNIIKCLKEKKLHITIGDEKFIISKEKKHDVHKINMEFEQNRSDIEKSYSVGRSRSPDKAVYKRIEDLKDEELKLRVKYALGNDGHMFFYSFKELKQFFDCPKVVCNNQVSGQQPSWDCNHKDLENTNFYMAENKGKLFVKDIKNPEGSPLIQINITQTILIDKKSKQYTSVKTTYDVV